MGNLIKNREIKVFTCYQSNITPKILKYQKKVFDYFDMNLIQESTTLSHGEYLDSKIKLEDFDIIVFFDIDAIPLKPNLYEYIVEQIGDNNSLIGVEQAANHIDSNVVYAGPSCFAISKIAFEKINKPSFIPTFKYKNDEKKWIVDVGENLTISAKNCGVNVKLFNITSSINKRWKCGKKWFGNGTIYDDWIYHQFEIRNMNYRSVNLAQIEEYQFINKCKEVLHKNLFDDKEIENELKEIQEKWQI